VLEHPQDAAFAEELELTRAALTDLESL
jgi:hypothetical protein